MHDLRTAVSSYVGEPLSLPALAEVEAADKRPADRAQSQHAVVERHHEAMHRLAPHRRRVLIPRLVVLVSLMRQKKLN
jgi:hypothetical protein